MRILFLLSILLYGCSHNGPMPSWDATDTVASQCYDEHNKPIAILNEYNAKQVMDMAYARYNIEKQRREIGISNDLKNQTTAPMLEFAFYHECAHHTLNHIKVSQTPIFRNMWGDKEMQEERDADEFALDTYYQHHDVEGLYVLYSALKESHLFDMKRMQRIKRYIQNSWVVGQ